MRKRIVLVAILVMTVPTIAAAGTIANTKHDLSPGSTNAVIKSTTQTDSCVFCHIAHNGGPAVSRPLWSHTLTSATLTWGSTGKTVRGTTIPTDMLSTQLAGSRACMSCHDGTVAVGDLSLASKGIDTTVKGGNAPAGNLNQGINYFAPANMQTNHPLGVSKPATVAGFTAFKTVVSTSAVNYDGLGNVQCDSCHNPHDNTFPPFLKINPAGGAICLTCHDV